VTAAWAEHLAKVDEEATRPVVPPRGLFVWQMARKRNFLARKRKTTPIEPLIQPGMKKIEEIHAGEFGEVLKKTAVLELENLRLRGLIIEVLLQKVALEELIASCSKRK
jgi:hypothetical protein